MRFWSRSVVCIAAGLPFILLGCTNDTNPSIPAGGIQQTGGVAGPNAVLGTVDFISSTGAGTGGAVQSGYIPTNGIGPTPSINGGGSMPQLVPGGSVVFNVSTAQPVSDLLIATSGQPGYVDLSVFNANATGPQTYPVVLNLPSARGGATVGIQVAARQNGILSGIASVPVTVNSQAQPSSTLQVSLAWDSPADLDLHLTIPGGAEIGYDKQAAGGGLLDLDSNSSCRIDNMDTEDISWNYTNPLFGTYVVRPDLYGTCAVTGPIPYVVTVTKNGVPTLYPGIFSPSEADANSPSPTAPSRSHLITFTYP